MFCSSDVLTISTTEIRYFEEKPTTYISEIERAAFTPSAPIVVLVGQFDPGSVATMTHIYYCERNGI